MHITTVCPHCSAQAEVSEADAGKNCSCHLCGKWFKIPGRARDVAGVMSSKTNVVICYIGIIGIIGIVCILIAIAVNESNSKPRTSPMPPPPIIIPPIQPTAIDPTTPKEPGPILGKFNIVVLAHLYNENRINFREKIDRQWLEVDGPVWSVRESGRVLFLNVVGPADSLIARPYADFPAFFSDIDDLTKLRGFEGETAQTIQEISLVGLLVMDDNGFTLRHCRLKEILKR